MHINWEIFFYSFFSAIIGWAVTTGLLFILKSKNIGQKK
jgi:hypothetical protein